MSGPSGNWIGQYPGNGGYVYDIYDSGWVRIVRSPVSDANTWVNPSTMQGRAITDELSSRFPEVAVALTRGVAGAAQVANQRDAQSRASTQSAQSSQAWSTINQVTSTFGPLIVDIIGAVAGNAGNSQANIAGRIAKLQTQLAVETNPVKRAKLQAELDSLRSQQATYSQIAQNVTQPLPGQSPPPLYAPTVAPSTSSWLPWVLGGGMALVALAVATGGQRR